MTEGAATPDAFGRIPGGAVGASPRAPPEHKGGVPARPTAFARSATPPSRPRNSRPAPRSGCSPGADRGGCRRRCRPAPPAEAVAAVGAGSRLGGVEKLAAEPEAAAIRRHRDRGEPGDPAAAPPLQHRRADEQRPRLVVERLDQRSQHVHGGRQMAWRIARRSARSVAKAACSRATRASRSASVAVRIVGSGSPSPTGLRRGALTPAPSRWIWSARPSFARLSASPTGQMPASATLGKPAGQSWRGRNASFLQRRPRGVEFGGKRVRSGGDSLVAPGPYPYISPLPNFARACGRVSIGGHPDKRLDGRQRWTGIAEVDA